MANGEQEPEKDAWDIMTEADAESKAAINKRLGVTMFRTAQEIQGTWLAGLWNSFYDKVILPGVEGIKGGLAALGVIEDSVWDWALKWMRGQKVGNKDIADLLDGFRDLPAGVQSIFNLLVLGSYFREYTANVTTAGMAETTHALNAKYRGNLPQPQSMVQAAFIAPEKTAEVRDILRKLGYKEDHIDLMFIAAYQLYDPATVQMLYLRKEITESKARERLAEMGYTDARVDELMKLWTVIPPIQDIITMVAKEAFEPDQIELYGLGEEFPEEQSEWLTKQGLSRFWQEKYWIAHWNYPSPQQVLDLLHRGLLTREDVNEYYRVVEMPRYWREKLMEASYRPYTRVDVRRMHASGVLGDVELKKAYTDIGYDDEHAEKMMEFTLAYNADTDKKLTQSQIIKAYRDSILKREDALELLKRLKFNDDQAAFYLSMADFDEALELQAMYIDAAKTRFLDNIWDENTTRSALAKLNLAGARIDALIEKWTPNRISERKLPSKTDLDKFLKNKVITEDQYKTEMSRLGYNFQYTDWYLKVAAK